MLELELDFELKLELELRRAWLESMLSLKQKLSSDSYLLLEMVFGLSKA